MTAIKPVQNQEFPEKELTEKIIGAAIEVHRILGPGLLESVYQVCLARELSLQNIHFEQEKPLPIIYKGVEVNGDFRMDFIVEDKIVLELKAVNDILPIHQAQLLTYLKLTGCKVGLLINFNVRVLKDGIRRAVN